MITEKRHNNRLLPDYHNNRLPMLALPTSFLWRKPKNGPQPVLRDNVSKICSSAQKKPGPGQEQKKNAGVEGEVFTVPNVAGWILSVFMQFWMTFRCFPHQFDIFDGVGHFAVVFFSAANARRLNIAWLVFFGLFRWFARYTVSRQYLWPFVELKFLWALWCFYFFFKPQGPF